MSSSLKEFMRDRELDIEDEIHEFTEYKTALVKMIQEFIQDLDRPLDRRWDVFTSAAAYLPQQSYYMSFKALGKNWSWYDDMYKDRYSVVMLTDVVDSIEESHADGERLEISIEALKEQILVTGYGSFENDW